jgi:LacI family transcriptional regulator
MAKRVTLSEIGKKAGVSDVSVGAALGLLSKNSSVRLNPQKAEMIRKVADELGYQPNLLARAFRSHLISVA